MFTSRGHPCGVMWGGRCKSTEADPSAADVHGMTPLHWAAFQGSSPGPFPKSNDFISFLVKNNKEKQIFL